MVELNDSVESTIIFALILLAAVLVTTVRKSKTSELFPLASSEELKGFAILAIIFAHIGYFLVADTQFLQPLSYFAGPGVDIFLLLSGYGLTHSYLNHTQSIGQFYSKHLPKLFLPMWISLLFVFSASHIVLGKVFSWEYVVRSFAGIFLTAEVHNDINAPLWYFTVILFYYLLFPIIFSRKFPWITSLIFFGVGGLLVFQNLDILQQVIGLYKLHIVAFPLGILVAWIGSTRGVWRDQVGRGLEKLKKSGPLSALVLSVLIVAVCYFGVNSGVGNRWELEQLISIITVLLLIVVFVLKSFNVGLFSLLGKYSYEIYLIHWPIAYLSATLWPITPAWIAMLIYLGSTLVCSILLHKLVAPKDIG